MDGTAFALFSCMINTVTLQPLAEPILSPGSNMGHSVRLARAKFQLSPKDILVLFRSLAFLVILVLIAFNEKNHQALSQPRIEIFLGFFTLSILAMFFLKSEWFENKTVLSGLFVVDTLCVTLGLYLSGAGETNLFLIFFITIFISALSQDVKSVFSVAAVACVLYGFLQYKTTGEFVSSDTAFLVRFPFLFVAAAMSGYMAMETKKHQEEKAHLLDLNQFLAGQADVSTQKLTETNRKLKSLLEYHHCVLSSLQTGVIVVQNDGKVRTFNSGCRKITGLVEAEMADKTLDEFPESLKGVAQALERTLAEGKSLIQDHLEIKTIRHEAVPVTMETSVLRAGNGEVIGAIATLKDVTLLRQMETQLIRSERFSALGEMAAGVAHEIKNPLNAIMGFSQRLGAKVQEPGLKKYAEVISEEVRRMDTIVNEVLEFSRPDKVHKEPTEAHRILDETTEFLKEKLEGAGVTVEKDYAKDLPPVFLDVVKIRQVLLNLFLNALQAMPKGGRLTLRTRFLEGLVPQASGAKSEAAIYEQMFLQEKMVSISVTDNGCGIPRENLQKLFHPFFTTKTTGTGLGLSVCHKIVTSHGGTLDVESELGKGSAFTIYLPVTEEK